MREMERFVTDHNRDVYTGTFRLLVLLVSDFGGVISLELCCTKLKVHYNRK